MQGTLLFTDSSLPQQTSYCILGCSQGLSAARSPPTNSEVELQEAQQAATEKGEVGKFHSVNAIPLLGSNAVFALPFGEI